MSDTPDVETMPEPPAPAPEPEPVAEADVPVVAESLEDYVETITVDEDAGTAAT